MALKQLGGAAKARVAGVVRSFCFTINEREIYSLAFQVVFGDPYKGQAIPGVSRDKVYTNCAASDPICAGIPCPCGPHLTYGSETAEMDKCVAFVKAHV